MTAFERRTKRVIAAIIFTFKDNRVMMEGYFAASLFAVGYLSFSAEISNRIKI